MLVTPTWLAERLDDPELVVLDVRWDERGTGRARYELAHVPGARYLDWASDLVDPEHRVAFTLAVEAGVVLSSSVTLSESV